MKRALSFLALILISITSYSAEVTKENIQGKWMIIKVGDLDTKDLGLGIDTWEFTNDKWIVNTSGLSLRPESFEIEGDEIKLDSITIKVIKLSENIMVTDTNGFIQTLEKHK